MPQGSIGKKIAKTMASSLPIQALILAFSLLLLTSLSLATPAPILTNHGGPLLTGKLDLSLLWYGRVGRVQKSVIRRFINSLNYHGGANLQPQVSGWWKMVESYQNVGKKVGRNPRIPVRVVKQTTDIHYSVGKILIKDFITGLVQKASCGNPNTVVVIFTARDVTVDGLCMGKCSKHGVIGEQPYILVGNPENECPGACAWPFYKSDYGPQGVILNPPNGNVGADAMVVAFASGLAETVTNPYKTGFFAVGGRGEIVEATTACPLMFGRGAMPGYTGRVLVDPTNGGAFNAYGARSKKFLLPAIWNPKTLSCWTLM